MKTFCSGKLSAPLLSRVRQTAEDQEGCWFGNLNATIPHLYMKDQKIAYQGIEHLELSRFPELMETWNKMSREIINLKILKHLEIYNSSNLRHIFSPSMAMELVHLEKLEIIGCMLLEEVVMTSGSSEDQRLNKKLFPRLVFLRLIALPLLTRFGSGDYFEFTYLKRLWVENCPLLGTFISTSENERMLLEGNIKEINLGNNLQADNQALFDKKVGFLSLEKLVIIDMDLKRISSNQISADSFCRPKVVKLIGVAKQSTSLPPCSPHLISNLQELVVGKADELRELFQCGGASGEIKHGWAQAQFRNLSLFKLPMLTHIWKEGFQPGKLFQNLITLKVSECSALKILVPSSVSFGDLTNLEIVECHGFLNLITPSTAKSLTQLQTLKISHCNLISEIVAPLGDGVEDGIIRFNKLKYIGLQFLPSLTSFCSGPYTFDFPDLDKLIVRGCPKLEKFSMPDDLKPQNLEKVCLSEEEDDWHWVRADNLNATIKHLYSAQKSSNHRVKELGIEQWSLENFL